MNNLYILILIVSLLLVPPANATDYDFSKWGYPDFAQVAQWYLADHNYPGALKYFDMAVKSEPNNPEGYLNRGGIYELLNQNDKALQDEQMALKLAQDNSKDSKANRYFAYLNIASIYLHQHKILDAKKEAEQARAVTPDHPRVYEILSEIDIKSGNTRDAIIHLTKARDLAQAAGDVTTAKELNTKISHLHLSMSESKK